MQILQTSCAGDATKKSEAAVQAGVDVILAAGGDGTLAEVVAGVVGTDVRVLPLPAGTECLVAKELGVPSSAEAIVQLLLSGHSKLCDVGRVNGRVFLAVTGVGFDAECVAMMARMRRGHITHQDYFWPIWRTFWSHRFPMLLIDVDGRRVFEGRGLAVVGAVSRYGGRLRLTPTARMDDGLLDLAILPLAGRAALLRKSINIAFGRVALDRGVMQHQCNTIRIDSPEGALTQIDGDPGERLPIDLSVQVGGIHFLTPMP